MKRYFYLGLGLCGLVWLLTACQTTPPAILISSLPTLAATAAFPTATFAPLPTALPTATPTLPPSTTAPLITLTPSITPTPSPTADLTYVGLTIDELTGRSYGGGQITIEEIIETKETFTRYLISYPSDGLKIYGFMNVPIEGDNFPVVLLLHGFMPLDTYEVQTYTTRYADRLAEAGYFVIHPNYRNHPPSDTGGPNLFRVEYAIDILNLIAIVQEQSQDPAGHLRRADGNNIFLFGHSMGGGITLRVITVRPEAVRAAVLYGSMGGDEQRNFEKVIVWSDGENGELELAAPPELLQAISPINFLGRLQTPLSIHHGSADATVPPEWSDELCEKLQAISHPVECFSYPNWPHTFSGRADEILLERTIAFFTRYRQ